jgi:hypothetical protein
VTDGHTAAPTATSTPNPPMRSGTENARIHDPRDLEMAQGS